MGLKMTTSDPTAIQELAEEDVIRLRNEMNYRLLMESELTDEVLWVEEITVTKVEPPVRGRFFIWLRAFVKRLACFKDKKSNRKGGKRLWQ